MKLACAVVALVVAGIFGATACGSSPAAPSAGCVRLENAVNAIADQQVAIQAKVNGQGFQNGNIGQIPQATWQSLNDAYNNAFDAWLQAGCPDSTMPKPGW